MVKGVVLVGEGPLERKYEKQYYALTGTRHVSGAGRPARGNSDGPAEAVPHPLPVTWLPHRGGPCELGGGRGGTLLPKGPPVLTRREGRLVRDRRDGSEVPLVEAVLVSTHRGKHVLALALGSSPPQERGYIGARLAENVPRTCHRFSTYGREALCRPQASPK